ncbi:hypothetical protein [Chryseobacterium sp.]|uniref:hypothetical protein n=1 Tax=Chryseobacterium sp. TaxID=1871047 RepID=UPI002633FA8C|nr:hypothetical protein [Chryseobacterium sp.]
MPALTDAKGIKPLGNKIINFLINLFLLVDSLKDICKTIQKTPFYKKKYPSKGTLLKITPDIQGEKNKIISEIYSVNIFYTSILNFYNLACRPHKNKNNISQRK